MRTAIRTQILILAGALSVWGTDARTRNFVACPVVRDTPTVPCWLAEYEGQTYFLGIQTDVAAEFHPPQLLHKVLVEGTISDGPKVCGGIVLAPVKVSVLPEIDASCTTMLPEQDGIVAPPASRGPGPSYKRTNPTPHAKEEQPVPPYAGREFTVDYDFDNIYLTGRVTRVVEQAIHYASAIRGSRITVVSYRGTTKLSNGQDLVENEAIARNRSEQMSQILRSAGVDAAKLTVRWETSPSKRSTTISVDP